MAFCLTLTALFLSDRILFYIRNPHTHPTSIVLCFVGLSKPRRSTNKTSTCTSPSFMTTQTVSNDPKKKRIHIKKYLILFNVRTCLRHTYRHGSSFNLLVCISSQLNHHNNFYVKSNLLFIDGWRSLWLNPYVIKMEFVRPESRSLCPSSYIT